MVLLHEAEALEPRRLEATATASVQTVAMKQAAVVL